jgi:predicted CoA-substrate-specific enzyme activase
MTATISIGIDVGSTTVKIVVLDGDTGAMLADSYERHNACQAETLHRLLTQIHKDYPDATFRMAVCGSGGKNLATTMNAHFVQEVVANSIAIQQLYPDSRVAIELGGQDAKIIFFYFEEHTGQLVASDMRMNGSCAGGTGAFLDEIASLLQVPVSALNGLATKGSHLYDISGRCGVFAKTDIQPLLNQGVSREDIALSTFHAVAKQTIGGLAQGLEIKPPIIFEGGPLTFNPILINVFAERLALQDHQIIRPENPQTIVAKGTALALDVLFKDEPVRSDFEEVLDALRGSIGKSLDEGAYKPQDFFTGPSELAAYRQSNQLPEIPVCTYTAGTGLPVYIGIDAGSTTTKFALVGEDGEIIDRSYHHNVGDPLGVIKQALVGINQKYHEMGVELIIRGVGTTGYGEYLFAKGFHADYHTVETVAHAEAAMKYAPDVSFVLDIGGQDMKVIQIHHGIVTGITLNEACSAGCGSFLENFASSLGVKVDAIADMAFASKSPSVLGSRCTVFMNSSIITEQKNGKSPEDIMAALCRSIIENVFTKVIRMNNLAALGNRIVVQGGTFKNLAVLRAMEQYTGQPVIRSPYPGEMGAIGIALLTRKYIAEQETIKSPYISSFIGFDGVEAFSSSRETNNICPFCTNSCNRTVVRFSTGEHFVIGNRCERGEILGDIRDAAVRELVKSTTSKRDAVPDLFLYREKLLFDEYPVRPVSEQRGISIGLPRVLEFWNSMPFWNTFFKALGFDVVISDPSTRKIYESGLAYVPSDTACFPAKLAHGHVRNLAAKHVDHIFMPMMGRMPSENPGVVSDFTCSVLKGYPMIVRASDEPEEKLGVSFLTPYFPWFDERSKLMQLQDFMLDTFGVAKPLTCDACAQADAAMMLFRSALEGRGAEILSSLEGSAGFAVVLGARPYQNDHLVNHDLSRYFTRQGVPVLTIDALPNIHDTELDKVRMDAVVNFHVRMVSGAMFAARNPHLEFVQMVSFGCGHDAILTDEIIDVMKKIADKYPLVIKVDESDVVGPLNVRVKSFLETITAKRKLGKVDPIRPMPEPFPVRFSNETDTKKILLIPNGSVAFCRLASSILRQLGFRAEPLPLIDQDGIKLAKRYTHNDVCYPAQINIGEFLAVMEKGLYKPDEVVLGMGKITCDCRLSHYPVIARKSLDDAGYGQVPIITTAKDLKLHPEANFGPSFEYKMVWGIVIFDILEAMIRRMRPYELVKGEVDAFFNRHLDAICAGFEKSVKSAIKAFEAAIADSLSIRIDDTVRKPRVFIIGEFLLNFHPISNNNIERYLESYGMEVMLPYMVDAFRKDYVRRKAERRLYHVRYPLMDTILNDVSDIVVQRALDRIGAIASKSPYFHRKHTLYEMARKTDHLVHHAYTSGEGWMIPGEIHDHASEGVNSFVIVQPFGCLPNHITGRGMIKRIKKDFPHIQILSLDYDPDTSIANIENRLQMLIINARELEKLNARMYGPTGH